MLPDDICGLNLIELLCLRKVVDDKGNIFYLNQDGKMHRLYGPAVIQTDGTNQWRINGRLHRTDGPAIEYWYGLNEWWENGRYIRGEPS